MRKVMSFDGEHGANWDSEQDKGFFSSYAAIETSAKDCRFGVVVVDGKLERLSSMKREEFLEYLSWLFLADDDELQFMRAPVAINHHGLTGKEYLYVMETTYDNLYTRGRIFDAGDKIYVIVFVGRNVKDLTSSDAEHFLNSFRLRASQANRRARRSM
jgi:hypothetical protein